MRRNNLLLLVIGVVVLVFVMQLVGGCHGRNRLTGDTVDHGTWWLNQVPEGYESGKLVVGSDNTWTLTMKRCTGEEETSNGTWTYCDDTEEYTMMEDGKPDRLGKATYDTFTVTGADDPLVFGRMKPTSPCP